MGIEIKGVTVPALMIKLQNEDIEENLKELDKKLSSAFFKGSLAILDVGDLNITEDDKKKIEKVLEKYNTKVLGYKFSEKTETKKSTIDKFQEKKTLKIINKTIRSGQRVEYDGDVLIIGDVNPDAYVVASGNIIVMGKIRGVVHAGANGDETSVVMALKLKPQQLRISNYITRSPDEDVESPEYPEKAFVENNQIFIEKI